MQQPPSFVLSALNTLQVLAQRGRDLARSARQEVEQLEAMRVRAVRDGNLTEARLLAAEIETTQANGIRLRKEAEQADWRHREAERFIDNLPEDTFVARAPEGPKPTANDPATALGIRVVALA